MDIILTQKLVGMGTVGDPLSVSNDRARHLVMGKLARYAHKKDSDAYQALIEKTISAKPRETRERGKK